MNNWQIAGLILLAVVIIYSILVKRDRIYELVWPYFPLFLIRKKIDAITLFPFIIYKSKPSTSLSNHEWLHIDCIREAGWWVFYYNYLFTKGYKEYAEQYAYNNQDNPRGAYK